MLSRYGGWSQVPPVDGNRSLIDTKTNLIVWYNNQVTKTAVFKANIFFFHDYENNPNYATLTNSA
jgi:hypothetical protein